LKLAAIDIGSNAARLLITEVYVDENNKTTFTKLSLVRVPLRLGFDVFETGKISEKKVGLLLHTMKGFLNISQAYEVKAMKTCATSAMRDADNTEEIISLIKSETGIEIEVISGSDEASLVFENHIAENLDTEHSYLYIDVGGGSTELTFFSNNKMIFKESFNIGTIRLLKNQVPDSTWDEMKGVVKNKIKGFKTVTAIGSGGNINKVFTGRVSPFSFFTEASEFTPTISTSAKEAASDKTAICPSCRISKTPFVNAIVLLFNLILITSCFISSAVNILSCNVLLFFIFVFILINE
jgi:exopolyphosphatase/guanosine-5'-triphosphate,3'-diphosphate pyrophosphatase